MGEKKIIIANAGSIPAKHEDHQKYEYFKHLIVPKKSENQCTVSIMEIPQSGNLLDRATMGLAHYSCKLNTLSETIIFLYTSTSYLFTTKQRRINGFLKPWKHWNPRWWMSRLWLSVLFRNWLGFLSVKRVKQANWQQYAIMKFYETFK